MNTPAEPTFSITDLSREFEVTTRTIRFYEDQGLLSPERRGRTRIYHKRDRARLTLILRGKRLGFSLSEIRYLLDLYDQAQDEKPQLRELLNALSQKRTALEGQKADIEALLAEMDSLAARAKEILGK
ncbi:MAG: MerR family DNA-binding transcriptional regulator [Chitinivorax sp.]|jgi:DNA-binding transcriptional MerR regulator